MEVCRNLDSLRAVLKGRSQTLALVPTMGNLHAGHLRLVAEAQARAGLVVVSLYVNPLQFGPGEDFLAYPRTLAADLEALSKAEVDIVFLPRDQDVYPRGLAAQTRVEVPGLSDILCGAFRPGHFVGVTTVVSRLLHLVGPDVAVFGKKDYQQWLLIRTLVADLGMLVEIAGVETMRASDGLALSSRNSYLTVEERRRAPGLYLILQRCADAVATGTPLPQAEAHGVAAAIAAGFAVDYVTVRRCRDLAPPVSGETDLVVLGAVRLGRTGLIDNLEFVRRRAI